MKRIVLLLGLFVFLSLLAPGSIFAATGTVRPDSDVTTGFATCTANGNGNCHFGVLDEVTEITGDLVQTGTGGEDNDEEEFTMTSAAGSADIVTSVAVKFQADTAGCNGTGDNCDRLNVRIFIDGAYEAVQTITLSTSDTLHTLTFNGTWTGDDDLQVEFVRDEFGGGNPNNSDDDVRIYQAYADITYTPVPTKAVFTNANRTITAGSCSGAAATFVLELQDDSSTPAVPTGSTVMRITSNTGGTFAVYSDDTCNTQLTNGDVTFTTSDTTKTVYITDTRKSPTTWLLTATKQSGPQTITNGTQTYTVNAGTVTKLVVTLPSQSFTDGVGNSGSVDTRTAGSSFTITKIRATDAFFNVDTTYSGSKTLAYAGPGNAPNSQAPSYTTAVSFTSGESTTTLTTTLYKAESVTITVTDGGSYGNASSSVTVDPGALYDFEVSVSTPQTAAVCFTGTNTVKARDQWQNYRTTDSSVVNMTTSGTSVTFYTASDCNTSTTQYTLSSGTANIYIRTTKKQSITITATKDGSTETGTSSSITVNPAAANAILVVLPGQTFTDGTGVSGTPDFNAGVGGNQNATAGTAFSVTLKAVDANNNLVDSGGSNYNGSKTLSYSDSTAGNAPDTTAPSFPSTSVTFTNGTSSSLSFTYYNAASSRTVEADDSGTPVSGSTSTTFTVDPDVAENYGVSAATPQTAGSAFNVTITARDDWNNSLGSAYSAPAGTYVFTTTAANAPDTTVPSLGTLVQGDFTNGVATKSVTLYKAESGVTFTVSEPTPSSVTGTSGSVTVNAAGVSTDAADSTITGVDSAYRNNDVTITITLKDAYQNPKEGVLGSDIDLSGTTGTFITTTSPTTTDSSGVSTAVLNWSTAGSKTVTADISGVGTLSDTHAITITVQPNKSTIQGGTVIRGGVRF